jgi:two-component system sensor histidine kinase RstB
MVGPLSPFESLPIVTIAMVMALMLTLLGTAIYFIMRSVEKRLTRLEQTTASFTAGDYNARVTIQEGEYLTQLGLAFNTMADQVQAVLSSQQDLMRAVSHEFRTPVARVRFALQMVDDMSESPGIRRLLKGVDDDIESIDRLIDEILTYARLDSATDGLLPLEPVSLEVRDIADRVVETLTPLHPQLTLEVTGGQELNVHADSRYLQRALQNLVSNACTHARSRVHVRLLGDERMVYLSVEDDGAGVPLEERERIFKPFARLDDSRTRHQPGVGGYGLGLAIVARIVQWHHGRITVDTAPELGGAQFILSLPRHYEAMEEYT